MILIVGCGFLGSYIAEAAVRKGEKTICTYRTENRISVPGVQAVKCDVTKEWDLANLASLCEGEKPVVFYLAAEHNIDRVFSNHHAAWEINVTALERFLEIMPCIDKLFFASTDCVYGENPENIPAFSESDDLCPVNVYGDQKAEAEHIVASHDFTCARLPFMTGKSLLSGKTSFYDNICLKLGNGESTEMIDGMRRSALSYKTVAGLLLKLASLDKESLPAFINIASDTPYTKYEIGLEIAKANGLPESLIKPITFEEGKKFFKDRRADTSVMSNALLKKTLEITDKLTFTEN